MRVVIVLVFRSSVGVVSWKSKLTELSWNSRPGFCSVQLVMSASQEGLLRKVKPGAAAKSKLWGDSWMRLNAKADDPETEQNSWHHVIVDNMGQAFQDRPFYVVLFWRVALLACEWNGIQELQARNLLQVPLLCLWDHHVFKVCGLYAVPFL